VYESFIRYYDPHSLSVTCEVLRPEWVPNLTSAQAFPYYLTYSKRDGRVYCKDDDGEQSILEIGPTATASVTIESRDRLIHGVISGTDANISVRVRQPSAGRDFGNYSDLFANLHPRPPESPPPINLNYQIYGNEEEMLSDSEVDAIENGNFAFGDQQVIFVRDTKNPALLHFYTVADDYSDIEITLGQ
jgi:hypothetical protein